MRLPFFHPGRDEVATVATNLITRFGLRAQEEASYLADLSLQMGSRRQRVLYEFVAREIEVSFLEARRRLGVRQDASDLAHPGGNDGVAEGANGGAELPELGGPAPTRSQIADLPAGLVAGLNLFDVDLSPLRRSASWASWGRASAADAHSGAVVATRSRVRMDDGASVDAGVNNGCRTMGHHRAARSNATCVVDARRIGGS